MNVYKPDEITISIGIPSALVEFLGLPFPTAIEIRDWVSITSNKPVQRFQHSVGIHGEPFVEMTRNTSELFTLNILQSSPDIAILAKLLTLQTFGEVGFPFSMFDNSLKVSTSPGKDLKQKSLYPVAYIVDEPTKSWALTGATWAYQIQLIAGATVYI